MTISIAPTEDDIITALRGFLIAVAPADVDAFQGEENRVPEPSAKTFMVMWPIMRPRLATNIDSYIDTAFMASAAGTTLTVTSILIGTIVPGATLLGTGVTAGTTILSQLSGTTGGIGTYLLSTAQTLSSRKLASGQFAAMQETEIVMQVDVHAPDLNLGGNLASTVATLFRDAYAVDVIGGINPLIAPLFASDPRQMPFVNGEQQVEVKWTLDLHMQANQTVSGIPQAFFDAVDLTLIDVEATYPAS